MDSQQAIEHYRTIPKVELHRHLEGSLRLKTMSEVSRALGLGLPGTGPLGSMVQVNEQEPYTFTNFLKKFETLRLFYRSPEIIGRITREAIADAAADNVHYMELRFTPVALSRAEKFPLGEVIGWVIEGARQAEQESGLHTGLIVSVNRHESPELADEVVKLALERQKDGIVGLDLAGNEADFSAMPFARIFQDAKKAGLHITVHAGEWNGAGNVVEAIEQLGAERIGHGVRIMEDPSAVALARERGVVFEVCITSNFQSGVVKDLKDHPLPRMIEAGLKVTLNSDDPSISRITLSDEYQRAIDNGLLDESMIQSLVLTGVRASFLPKTERKVLARFFERELSAGG
jgi:adenosine deaminase